ncbi:MAG: GlsB/YeaQ/YmgE family stress response membrane protein [Candidatus Dormibacteraceae bacterium]
MGASSVIVATVILASRLNLDPGSWISWIVVGLIAGAIAARVVAGRGFGCLADIVVGVAGAIIGGFLLGALFNTSGTVGFWGSIVVAFIGAAVLLSVLKLLSGGRL